ncbi:hypothetical protein [Shewanella sp. YLB-07]|nr:hypothetical protein [Shewanella sp. YLB-07]
MADLPFSSPDGLFSVTQRVADDGTRVTTGSAGRASRNVSHKALNNCLVE